MRGRGRAPGFSGGSGKGPALHARDAVGRGGGRGRGGRGGFKKTLNGNYMNGGDKGRPEGAASAEESNKKARPCQGARSLCFVATLPNLDTHFR